MRESDELLEWPVLFEHLLAECLTPYGVSHWQNAPFLPDIAAMRQHIEEVDALKILLMRYGDVISETGLPDITPVIRRLEKVGTLNLNEIRHVMQVLVLGGRLVRHFAHTLRSEPQLSILAPLLDEELIPQIVLDYLGDFVEAESGDIKDSASPELASLKHRFRQRKQALQNQVQRFLSDPETSSALQSATVSEREGRMVFPVKVEYKSKLPGVIHGASGSGATIFVEPQALVELNNALQTLQAEIQEEIERILRLLSIYLHGHWEALEQFTAALGRLDRRLSAARFARLINAEAVAICDEPQVIELRQARHPLLVLKNRQQDKRRESPKPVIANDIRLGLPELDGDGTPTRTLVITGPNTGGKTVLLKTLGLFALMLKAGLQLPVAEGSRMAHFDAVLADIGDQQSIAASLSTFSAHIERLKRFIADETDLSRGLVLIDEIAAGTDPAEGAALARAILDELYQKGALTIVTTHLGELKLDAHQHPGFMNASVEFNATTLSPTYRLMLGVPGASNALTIAQTLGIKDSVIQRARASLSAPVRESAELLQELEQKNRTVEDELQKTRAFRLAAEETYEKVALERQQLENDKRQTLKQFQTSLKGRIHDLENQVKELRKALQEQDTQALKPHKLERLAYKLRRTGQQADDVFSETRDSIAPAAALQLSDLKVGEKVFSRQLEITGEITALQPASNEVVLQAGIMRLTVPVSDLQRPYEPRAKKKAAPASHSLDLRKGRPGKAKEGDSVLDEPLDPSLSCDVRGQRADEALQQVEKFLDEAVMAGYQAVAVIHGMGTGALKREIRSYLADSGYVKRFYPAQATQGGDGKTIIELSG